MQGEKLIRQILPLKAAKVKAICVGKQIGKTEGQNEWDYRQNVKALPGIKICDQRLNGTLQIIAKAPH